MRWIQMAAGNVPAPFDCYLMVRSIKTLALRCLQHGLSTLALAAHLEAHPLVESVLYPGLKTHPHHARTRAMVAPQVWKDLKSRTGWEAHGVPFGGVLSFRIKGSDEAGASRRPSPPVLLGPNADATSLAAFRQPSSSLPPRACLSWPSRSAAPSRWPRCPGS